MGKRENDITEAIHKAVNCFAMASILEKRIICIDFINKKLTFLGLILPIGMGYIAVSSDKLDELDKIIELIATSHLIKAVFIIAIAILGIIQTIVSLYSKAHKWNENLPIYINSKIENNKNAEKYSDIWHKYYEDEEKYSKQLEETNKANEVQQKIDQTINITPKEKRYGMRCALREYKIKCAGCGEKPIEIKTKSTCPVCGK